MRAAIWESKAPNSGGPPAPTVGSEETVWEEAAGEDPVGAGSEGAKGAAWEAGAEAAGPAAINWVIGLRAAPRRGAGLETGLGAGLGAGEYEPAAVEVEVGGPRQDPEATGGRRRAGTGISASSGIGAGGEEVTVVTEVVGTTSIAVERTRTEAQEVFSSELRGR